MDYRNESEKILWRALRTARPQRGAGVALLRAELMELAGRAAPDAPAIVDGYGNLWIDARTAPEHRTMFCAHLDTVEQKDGEKEIFLVDGRQVDTGGKAVLGADDGAGVAILAGLLAAGVPGLYLFTDSEETGGGGMLYALGNPSAPVAGAIDRAVAFDRKGTGEICGDQCVGTLASVAFVDALSAQLGLGHTWGHGTYTDNSEWQGVIPEIVNISVGYAANHSKMETLDMDYWRKLRDAAVIVGWDDLPTIGPDDYGRPRYSGLSYDYSGSMDWDRRASYHGPDDDADIALTDTLWDILDPLGVGRNDYLSLEIEDALARFRDRLRAIYQGAPRKRKRDRARR